MNTALSEPATGRPARPSLLAEVTKDSTGLPESKSPYFKFDKALFDALLRCLAGVELKVALAVERHTTGHYAQEHAEISISLLTEWTGCSKNAVLRARRRLLRKGVIQEVRPPTTRRGARLRVNRDPGSWGAISAPLALHLSAARGTGNGPQGSTICTSSGAQKAPLEVSKSHPLNGLNIYEEISERGQEAGDDSGESPASGLAAFHAGLKDAPDFARARIRGLPTTDQPCPNQEKELP